MEAENARAVLDALLGACPEPQELLSIKCRQNSTCLHQAMATRSGVLTGIVLHYAGARIPDLLRAQDKKLNTPLHEAIRKECFDGLDMALSQLDAANLSILRIKGEGGLTTAQLCANEGATERPLPQRPRRGFGGGMFGFGGLGARRMRRFHHEFDDLDDCDDFGRREKEPNPLFTRMMGSILKVDEGQSAVLLGEADGSGLTPFHYAAMHGNVGTLELMKTYLDKNAPAEVMRILSLRDSTGKTATDVARKKRIGGGHAAGPSQDAYEYLEQFVPSTPNSEPILQGVGTPYGGRGRQGGGQEQ